MRKVLVVAGSAKDYSSAKQFGDIAFVSYGSTNLTNTSRHIADFQNIVNALAYEPYVLISGYAVLNLLLVMCVMKRWGQVEMLIWDAKKKSYSSSILSNEMFDSHGQMI